jgi:hypothetical protein
MQPNQAGQQPSPEEKNNFKWHPKENRKTKCINREDPSS